MTRSRCTRKYEGNCVGCQYNTGAGGSRVNSRSGSEFVTQVDPELEGEGEKQDLTIHMFKPGQLDIRTGEETLVTCQIMAAKAL